VIREAVIAACLTGLMILLFLGSWRSTIIIAVSIPLSILTSVLVLSALHETINIMTLGGLALAVGILVDDATVEIENVNRNLDEGKETRQAILDGAQQIAVPALVSTLCICIVFLPMFFLSGVARYLFVPLAEAVVFAMLASYGLSRTLVPTLALYLLKVNHPGPSRNPFVIFQRAFERGFERMRDVYEGLLATLVHRRILFVPLFLLICLSAFLLYPWLGQDFFPTTDTGQFKLHMRVKTGTRIEETARICDLVEQAIRRQIPKDQVASVLDEIGLPYSSINTIYSNSAPIGSADADIFVSLNESHRPTEEYVRILRASLPKEFPGDDRRSGGGQERGSQPRFGGPDHGPDAPRPRDCGLANPAVVRRAQDARFHRPHQGGAEWIHAKRCRAEPADCAQRQFPDPAYLLAQS
jgi:multidrug efflux pump subunit AcrB